jgi:hypothetical protein
VHRCADPRLRGKYPPKDFAKVILLVLEHLQVPKIHSQKPISEPNTETSSNRCQKWVPNILARPMLACAPNRPIPPIFLPSATPRDLFPTRYFPFSPSILLPQAHKALARGDASKRAIRPPQQF